MYKMSVNPPPSPNVNRFNNIYWISADDGLTIGVGDLRYLKFPNAQGTETLLTTNVNGTLTATGLVNFTNTNPPTSSATQPASTDSSTKIPTTAWVQTAITTASETTISTAVATAGFQEGLILQDKNYDYNTIVGMSQNSIFAGVYNGTCFACSANGSVCGVTNGSGADVWFYLPVGTGGAPQVNFNSAPFNFDFLTFSADGKWGLLLGEGGGVNSTDVYRWDGSSFTITNAPALPYVSACMSANGKYALIADVSGAERLRKSTNYGLDWVRVAPVGVWYDVCMSATGKYMFGMSQFDDGYVSSDYGVTWTAAGIGSRSWYRCCMSANGQYIIALANDNGLADRGISSNDFGVTWTIMGADQKWIQTAMTDDGRFQVAWYSTGYYYSSNFGASWTDATGNPTPRMTDDGRARFTNQGKYIVGNESVNCNYSVFSEIW